MSATGRHGRPTDEMFLQRKNTNDDPPIVEPLRIQKRTSSSSQMSTASQPQPQQQQQPSGSHYPMPALPSMPGLPYPDDRARQEQLQAQAARANASSSPFQYPNPNSSGKRVGSPDQNRANSASPYFDPVQRAGSAGSGRVQEIGSSTIAERRGNNAPKPLPESPGPEAPDKEGLFQRPFQRPSQSSQSGQPAMPQSAPATQTSFPAPTAGDANQAAMARLNIRDPNKINRIDSTASTSTTKATRGSPPPPETPIMPQQFPLTSRPLTDIEQRFANSGIAGTGTLTALQAQSAASQARAANYGGRKPSQAQSAQPVQPPQRPWTPTEAPGASAHPAPIVFQGDSEVSSSPPPQQQHRRRTSSSAQQRQNSYPTPSTYSNRQNVMENETNKLHVTEEPPPAYSSVTGARPGQYAAEKGRIPGQTTSPVPVQSQSAQPVHAPIPQQHPAFANDTRPVQSASPDHYQQQQYQQQIQNQQYQQQQQPQQQQPQLQQQQSQFNNGIASPAPLSSLPQRQPSLHSPPPLPEGWIAHLDPNSGQYYYIHLPTQATQWEFPKGPTPLNLGETPLSPVGSLAPLASPGLSFMTKPLASPGIPMSPGFDQQSVMSGGQTSVAFTGPPPSSGVELYKVNATNGVYFGPYLRYINMDLELGFWYGSIMLITDAPQPPTIHIHQTQDLSPNPRQLKAQNIATHQRWTFYKYEIDLRMEIDGPAKWTYAITSHLGCTRYEFLVAGRYETNWRFVAISGNDFSLNTGANERARLGGPGYMWKDIMQKHAECGGFHVQLGLGGQISADRLWKEIPSLRQWLAQSGKENRKNAQWTAAHEEDVTHAYFHYYTSHFDQPFLREAFAQIPHVCTIDDHDM